MRYADYYELSEKTGWRTTDLDWSKLAEEAAAGQVGEFDRKALMATAVIEHGVPHYAEVWSLVEKLREHWELWQFTTLWTGEEHRHSYALQKACETLGIAPQVAADLDVVTHFRFAEGQKRSCPDDCYRTVPGMLTYAMIQELATNHFYTMASKSSTSPFMKELFRLIGGDEMRHHCFYRDALRSLYEASDDKPAYVDQCVHATQSFKMPHLIYDLQVQFFEHGGWTIGEDIKLQLARCFSFDMTLLARLMADFTAPPKPTAQA
jgi:hypothetical protein